MILLSLVFATYVGVLLSVRAQPQSLRSAPESENLRTRASRIRGTLILGCGLIAVAMLSFDGSGLHITPRWEAALGESQGLTVRHGWVFQLLTSNFAHFNLDHLLGNLFALGLLSAYERRVGWRRHIVVFTAAAIFSSILDLLVLPENSISMGASAGICGLAAAYYLDEDNLTLRVWIYGAVFVLFFVVLLSLLPAVGHDDTAGHVNWIAHILGAISGAIYVRISSLRPAARWEDRDPPVA